jgi:hypothetical protein
VSDWHQAAIHPDSADLRLIRVQKNYAPSGSRIAQFDFRMTDSFDAFILGLDLLTRHTESPATVQIRLQSRWKHRRDSRHQSSPKCSVDSHSSGLLVLVLVG